MLPLLLTVCSARCAARVAQAKARALAAERGVKVNFELADVHTWQYPEAAFDVVVEIFTQFSSPGERRLKWAGMRRTLKPSGRSPGGLRARSVSVATISSLWL